MQNELSVEYPDLQIAIIGINEIGMGSGNTLASAGRDIPWLQDTAEQDVGALWTAGFRDVIIVDASGSYYATYNLTAHNLSNSDNFEELRALLVEASTQQN